MENTTRRNFLLGALGLLGLGGVGAWFKKNDILRWMILKTDNSGLKMAAAPKPGEDICLMTSKQVEGPYFISSPVRKDIRENRNGKAMNLKLQILRMPDCRPIEGASVEIWQCDAEGIYSGYPEDLAHDLWGTLMFAGTGDKNVKPVTEARFLRGAQMTDAAGNVEFTTIFPGWYEPRVPHIHLKVNVDEKEQLVSQFYFETEFCRRIFLNEKPYDAFGDSPFTLENDIVISENLQLDGLLLQPVWNDGQPLEASARVGIQRSA